jgi:protoheme IX farnesyltransferase
MGTLGVTLIGYYLNATCSILAFTSLMLYAFAYTPLKKVSKIAVHIGAIPGAISPLIGYVAATGKIDFTAISLFVIQFVWQFPHFYAIAWQLDDDYKKVGMDLLPIGADKNRAGAIQIAVFTLLLLPISFLPVILSFGSIYAALALLALGIFFFVRSIQLIIDLSDKSARKLMFASFIYLPVVFIIMLIDKIL